MKAPKMKGDRKSLTLYVLPLLKRIIEVFLIIIC